MHPLVNLYLNHLSLPLQSPSYEYLCELQKQHIESIPHENIDGIYNIHTSFNIPHLLNKYVVEKRGGLCFELNYSFGWLLHQLGFGVEIILADVMAYEHHAENNAYPTHPIIIVHFDDKKFVTDVGWSDSYRHPLALTAEEYTDHTGKYRVSSNENKFIMQKWLTDQDDAKKENWYDQFIFDTPKEPLKDYIYPKGFLAAHAYTHIGKGYLFTNLFKFTHATTEGHYTIWGDKLLTKQGTEKNNTLLPKEVETILQEDFQVATHVAKKCVPLTRSKSMMFTYVPIEADKVIEEATKKPGNKQSPF